jgi:hypothetical protein
VDPHKFLVVGIWGDTSLATRDEGGSALWDQFLHQGLDPVSIMKKVKALRG